MAKINRLKEYDEVQWNKRQEFEKKLEQKKEELYDGRDIENIDSDEFVYIQNELKKFVNKEHPERSYFVKYNNFILDVRKPSFGCFLLFIVLTIIGFITVFKWIF